MDELSRQAYWKQKDFTLEGVFYTGREPHGNLQYLTVSQWLEELEKEYAILEVLPIVTTRNLIVLVHVLSRKRNDCLSS